MVHDLLLNSIFFWLHLTISQTYKHIIISIRKPVRLFCRLCFAVRASAHVKPLKNKPKEFFHLICFNFVQNCLFLNHLKYKSLIKASFGLSILITRTTSGLFSIKSVSLLCINVKCFT